MSATSADQLAGNLRIAPGRPCPHGLHSSRRDWASHLTVGMPAHDLPARLGSIYSLCGESHRLCARMALAKANGELLDNPAQAAVALQQETLREHLRRICLDWPRQLAVPLEAALAQSDMQALLRHSPLFQSGALPASANGALQHWLAADLLGMNPADWLRRWERQHADWLSDWCAHTALPLPRLLQGCRERLHRRLAHSAVLRVHAHTEELQQLAIDMEQSPGFVLRPHWRAGSAETGSWSRLHETFEGALTPWLRLGARVAELVRLALPDRPGYSGAQWLSMGSVSTGPKAALAWVEMARGLLVHHVRLDSSGERVQSCRVLAPTEWNFHASGSVAQALATLPQEVDANVLRDVDGLVSAWDPCLSYELNLESAHA